MKKAILIVAGGSGSRMQSEIPKQFMLLAGEPVLMQTIRIFFNHNAAYKIVVVLPEKQRKYWDDLCRVYRFDYRYHSTVGGATRFHSVQNGLTLIDDDSVVAIHDGVRPLVSPVTIERCFDVASQFGNAVPYGIMHESVRIEDSRGNRMIDREQLRIIQTPQTFRAGLIKEAYQQPYNERFTDDALVLESAGHSIHLVEGNAENIKITTLRDLKIAELLWNTRINNR